LLFPHQSTGRILTLRPFLTILGKEKSTARFKA
jgi:hypothetical protein